MWAVNQVLHVHIVSMHIGNAQHSKYTDLHIGVSAPKQIWIFPIPGCWIWGSPHPIFDHILFISLRPEWMNIWSLACGSPWRCHLQQIFIFFTPWMNESWPARGGGHIDWNWPGAQKMTRNGRDPLCSLRFPCFSSKIRPGNGTRQQVFIFFYAMDEWILAAGSPIPYKYPIVITKFLFIFTPWMNEYLEPGRRWTRVSQTFTPMNNIFRPGGEMNRLFVGLGK